MSEIEQEFFKVFGIEPKYICTNEPFENLQYECTDGDCNKCKSCEHVRMCYPDITADKLLHMICILNETACEVLAAENMEDLKSEILETCIKVYNTPILTSDGDEYENTAIYDKIQQLFNGGIANE